MGKLQDNKMSILQKVDVTFGSIMFPHVEYGLQSTRLSTRLLHELPHLKGIVLTIKRILAQNELNVCYTGKVRLMVIGGLNSYSLLLLCAAYYSIDPYFQSAGEGLLRILCFYGHHFNNMLYGIYYDGHSVYSHLLSPSRAYFPLISAVLSQSLVIQDPFCQYNNVTASLYRFNEIRACFAKTYSNLVSTSYVPSE